jgi:hypothetical protein
MMGGVSHNYHNLFKFCKIKTMYFMKFLKALPQWMR